MKYKQKGFTVVELMIATTVFSFVLLVASSGVIAIGKIYYKGITSAKTQETTRTIMEEIARARQFSGGNIGEELPAVPIGGLQAYCFGEDRYSYIINSKLDLDADPNGRALFHDIRTNLSQCEPQTSVGEELLSDNMRLLEFSIEPVEVENADGTISISADKSTIKVKVAYGDNDLLSNYDDSGNPNGVVPADALCKGGAGSTFCSTAQLETVVGKRYAN